MYYKPSQYPIAMYKYPSSVSKESLYETILGCFNFARSLASCSAAFRSLFEAFLNSIFFNTY